MSATTTTLNYQEVSMVDYIFKRATAKKIKTDGLQNQTVISVANEKFNVVDVVRSDRIWADSGKLVNGPSGSNVPAVQQATVPFFDIHNRTGVDTVSDLRGRAWTTSSFSNWISPEFNAAYTLSIFYGQQGTTPVNTIDQTLYPWAFDYGAGVLTFIGDVPPTLANGTQIVYISGYTYSGIVGTSAVSGTFASASVVTGTASLSTLGSSNNTGFIDCTATSLSNIATIDITSVTANQTNNVINMNQTTLSNVATVDVGTVATNNLQSLNSSSINVNQTTLSNIATVDTAQLTGATNGGFIDVTNTTLSNVNDLYVNNNLYVNSIQPISGSTISFNGADINSVKTLSVTDSLNVAGEFIVTNLTSSNTEQLVVNNAGLQTALVVNQVGTLTNANVAEYRAKGNTVMVTNVAGQTGFGSFGASAPTSLPSPALVYMENPSASNQAALFVKQDNSAQNILTMQGTDQSINVTATGRIGIGSSAPTARIDALSDASTTFMNLHTSSNANAFVIGADGHLGVNTASTSAYQIAVSGTVSTTSAITSNLSSLSSIINVSANTLSNVAVAQIGTTRATTSGTAAAPTFTFDADAATGVFQPATGSMAFATAGAEQMRILSSGRVGINTSAPAVQLEVNGTDAIRIPAGTSAQRPAGVAGYVRYNSDVQSFEGFGPGGMWGSLGGVKDVAGTTYISAEITPGSHDCNIIFHTNGVESMRVAANTNVGIGTSVAPYKLTVAGTASASTVYTGILSTLDPSSNIDVNHKSLSNVSTVSVANITSDVQNINVSAKSLSNVSTLDVQTLTASQSGNVINASATTLSNLSTLSVATITSDATVINVSGKSLCNINNLDISSITAANTSNIINASTTTLSNLTAVKAVTTETTNITTTAAGGLINVSGNTLSNVSAVSVNTITSDNQVINVSAKTLSNVNTLDVAKLTASKSSNIIDASATTLSNLTAVNAVTAQITNVTTTAAGGKINVSGNTFSNVSTMSVANITSDSQNINVSAKSFSNVNTLDVQAFTASQSGNVINASATTLSNLSTLSVATLTSDSAQINVSNKSLSNVSTLDVAMLTSLNNNSIINAPGITLSNMTNVKSVTVQATNLTTTAAGGLINVSGNTLSNVSSVSVNTITSDNQVINVSAKTLSNVNTLDVATLTASKSGNVINASATSLSNLTAVKAVTTETTNITTTAAGGLINVSGNTLSNVSSVSVNTITSDNQVINVSAKTLSNVNTLDVATLTASKSGNVINASATSLSNLSTLSVATITSDASVINVSGKSLCNINNLDISSITAANTNNIINASATTLSNLTNVKTVTAEVTNVTTTAVGGQINVSGNSLSNITTVNTSGVVTSTLSATVAGGGIINATTSSLSNLTMVNSAGLQTSTLAGSPSANLIDATTTTLSNLGSVHVNPGSTVYTNSINTASGSNVSFNNNDVSGINNLTVNTSLNVAGDFIVTNVLTSNAERFAINNIGMGPALSVNQSSSFSGGAAAFTVDSNLAFFVNKSRQAGFGGSFSSNMPDTLVNPAQVYIESVAADAQDALYIQQDSTAHNIVTMVGPAGVGACNVVVDAYGHVGVGTATPTARMHVYHGDSATTEFVRLSTAANANSLVVGADGRMGLGVAASASSNSTLTVAKFVESRGFVAPSGTSFLDFNAMTLSNVNTIETAAGSASAPAHTFNGDATTGAFQPSTGSLAFATAGSERVRIDNSGRVGINTSSPVVQFEVATTDAIRIPSGTTSQRPASGVNGYIRYNSDYQSFEGFGPGSNWGSLGGVKDVAGTTYISAELTPNSHDCNIRFFNNGVESMRVASNMHVGIGTTVTPYLLTVGGTASAQTVYTNVLSTLAGSSAIDVDQKTLSNISTVNTSTVNVNNLTTSAPGGVINGSTTSLSNLTMIDTANIMSTLGNGFINMNATTLCNLSNVDTGVLTVNQITTSNAGGIIDMSSTTLSNINTVTTENLNSTNGLIDVNRTSLSNIFNLYADKVSTSSINSSNGQLDLNWANVVNVDSIVVRSNITFQLGGTGTITGLPTDIVRLDPSTGQILDQYISSNLVRLMNDGQINPALIPNLTQSQTASFVKTMDKVGVGLRNPQQKLHVNGNQAITGGRLAIGLVAPLSSLHVYDDNASVSRCVHIESAGSTDILGVYGSNTFPALYIDASCNVGVGTSAPMYALDVPNGTGSFQTVRTAVLASPSGTIDVGLSTLSNVFNAFMKQATIETLHVTSNIYTPVTLEAQTTYAVTSTADTFFAKTISSANPSINVTAGLNITGYDTSLYSSAWNTPSQTQISLLASQAIVAKAMLTVSDKRAKTDIVDASPSDDLDSILAIPVKRFKYIEKDGNAQDMAGFLAQDVEKIAPYAVHTITSAIPSIMSPANWSATFANTLSGLSADSLAGLAAGDSIKLLDGSNKELVVIVESIDSNIGTITFTASLPSSSSYFIYGKFVNDFKVLDMDRLLPLTFNAVKELNMKVAAQQSVIDSILDRLEALEA